MGGGGGATNLYGLFLVFALFKKSILIDLFGGPANF